MIKHGILSWTYMKSKGIQVPYSYNEIREPLLWEILDSAGKRSVVINWFNTYPAQRINGLIVSDFARRIIQAKDPKRLADTVFPRALFDRLVAAVDRNSWRVWGRLGLPDYRKLGKDLGLDKTKIPLLKGIGIFMAHEDMLARLSWDFFEHTHFKLFARYSRFPDVVCHLLNEFLPKVAVVAPTVLHLLDLPVGRKMDGHAALEILAFPRPVRYRSYYRRGFVCKHFREFDQSTLEELRTLSYMK